MLCKLDLSKGKSGIGPNNWGLFRHLLPYHKTFHHQGVLHDRLYTRGGTEFDKILADELFLEKMLEIKTGKLFAKLYYKLVKTYGHEYFNYA